MGEVLQPPAGNYELQTEFLEAEQRRISAELFEAGVASRILSAVQIDGTKTDVSGFAQLDKVFTPSFGRVRQDERSERELSLVAITPSPNQFNSYSYFRLGTIDDAGILYPYPNVPPDDAHEVYERALALVQEKGCGILPNLSANLLTIDNPRTAITIYQPPEQAV